MKYQETYDKIRDHLMTQGAKSSDEDGCLYRGPNNTSCAIGCLIGDGIIRPRDNTASVDLLPKKIQRVLGIKNDADRDFLCRLQRIHDQTPVDDWPGALYDFAIERGLRP